jgi:hypothetical protein
VPYHRPCCAPCAAMCSRVPPLASRSPKPHALPAVACVADAARCPSRFGPLADASSVPKQRIGFLTFARGDDGARCLEAVNGCTVRPPARSALSPPRPLSCLGHSCLRDVRAAGGSPGLLCSCPACLLPVNTRVCRCLV